MNEEKPYPVYVDNKIPASLRKKIKQNALEKSMEELKAEVILLKKALKQRDEKIKKGES